MKKRVTKKAIRQDYKKIICIGYCNLQHLLRGVDPFAYTTRAEGWGADVYDVDGVAIVTGYDPFGNIRPSYVRQRYFDDAARAVWCDCNLDYETQKSRVYEMLRDFVGEYSNK